jgi:dimethylargininase
MLRRCGADVKTLTVNRDLPACVDIEDTAIVLDEVAILTSMGHEARRPEPAGIEPELRKYREVRRIELPATIDGGDVLLVGRTLLAGLSARTNEAGVRALEAIVRDHGYNVLPVPVRGCLHFKSACTALPDQSLLLNPSWLDTEQLSHFEWVRVPGDEPDAANVALVGNHVCMAASHPHTADLIRRRGFDVQLVDLSEFAKAEGCVTCMSLLLRPV